MSIVRNSKHSNESRLINKIRNDIILSVNKPLILCISHSRKNEYTLFTSALSITEDNAKVWNNIGHALEAEGNWEEAFRHFNKAAT